MGSLTLERARSLSVNLLLALSIGGLLRVLFKMRLYNMFATCKYLFHLNALWMPGGHANSLLRSSWRLLSRACQPAQFALPRGSCPPRSQSAPPASAA